MSASVLKRSKCRNCGGGIRLRWGRRGTDSWWSHIGGLHHCPTSPVAEPIEVCESATGERQAALSGDRDALKRYFGAALDRARASERELLALRLEVEIRPLVGKDHAILDHAIRIIQDDE